MKARSQQSDMPGRSARHSPAHECRPDRHCGSHALVDGPDYRILDLVCGLGPTDPPSENEYRAYRVATVIEGSFLMASSLGDGIPVAGSLILGNPGNGYRCHHVCTRGDRCIAFDFTAEFLDRVCGSLGVHATNGRFRQALVAPSPRSMAIAATLDALLDRSDPDALRQAAFLVAAAGITASHALETHSYRSSARDANKIAHVARYIEAHADQPCTLDSLAAGVGLSPFHFLRLFRRMTGQTPHRYVLATRLRLAARELRRSDQRVVDVAHAAGFGDLSNFNANFTRAFGMTPSVYRLSHRSV